MLLLEHQGKQLLAAYGIAIPRSILVRTMAEAFSALKDFQDVLVLKAQVPTGGRGKAGGIRMVFSKTEALVIFEEMMSTRLLGHQTESVLLEERVAIADERYLALSATGGPLQLLFGKAGGVDIENLSTSDPRNVKAIAISASTGILAEEVRSCLAEFRISEVHWPHYLEIASTLLKLARERDAELVEINPLAETKSGELVALDARISIDDKALPRQRSTLDSLRASPSSNKKKRSQGLDIRWNPEGGRIGLVGLGSGLNTTLMDWIAEEGSKVKAVVDVDEAISSGYAEDGFREALAQFEADNDIKAVLINIIACGYRLDDVVQAMLPSLKERIDLSDKPILLHLRGNAMSDTPKLLEENGYVNSATLHDAVMAVIREAGSM